MHLYKGSQQCECEGQRGLKDRGNYCAPDCAPIHMREHALRNICFPMKQRLFGCLHSVGVATIGGGSGPNVCGQKCEWAGESD